MTPAGLHFTLITTFYPPYHFGGDGNYVRQMAHVLAAQGHRVDIIHDRDAWRLLAKRPDPAPLDEPDGIRVFGLESRFGALSCLATQQTGYPLVHGRRIRAILDECKPDIIHFHNISLVGGPGILACGDALKLYTAHEHWLVCPSHILWRHNREVCTGRECLRCVLHNRRPPQLWRYSGLLGKMAGEVDAFCSPSHFSAAKHREFGFSQPMTVMPSFLPDTGEAGDDPGLQAAAADRPYFLFVGRLEIIKGLQDVIPQFLEHAPADLWIAGSGDYEAELRRLAGDSPHIRFLGQVPGEQLRPLYANAIAAITPSRCYEVFPLVVLEAFRERTPIIARAHGPYPEIVDHSGGGLLFNSEQELRTAIETLSRDAQLRQHMGASGYASYLDTWSQGAAMTTYFDLLRKLAAQRDDRRLLAVLANCTPEGNWNGASAHA